MLFNFTQVFGQSSCSKLRKLAVAKVISVQPLIQSSYSTDIVMSSWITSFGAVGDVCMHHVHIQLEQI